MAASFPANIRNPTNTNTTSSSSKPHLHHHHFRPSGGFSHYYSAQISSSKSYANKQQDGGGGGVVSRDWRNSGIGDFIYNESEEDDESEGDDRSLDLLVRFVQNMFRKISKRARKAVRSVLPVSISTQLVGFSVNGVIILAFMWVLKAFLQVVCTFGSLVFVSILLIRGIWSGISYLQENRNRNANDFDDTPWTGAQPAS